MKVFFRNIHLYLGLAAGLVIMSCCFTGAVLVFEKELQEAFNHDRYFVKQQNLHLPIEQLINNVKHKYSAAKIASVKIYSDPTRSVEIGVSLQDKGQKGKGREGKPAGGAEQNIGSRNDAKSGARSDERLGTAKATSGEPMQKGKQATPQAGGGGRPTHTAFVNPYTGQVIELYNYRETFFFTMFSLHRWLLGGDDSIGKMITGVSTFIFLFILITGIILWWPKNKAILKQRLKIKTNVSWKRINHDLHLVLGFYSAIFLFIFAFTALAWSFKWFNDGIYTVTKSSPKPAEPPHSIFVAGQKRISYDAAFIAVSKAAPDAQYYGLRAPNDSTGIFTATVLRTGANEFATDNYYIDQYSGQLIGRLKFQDKNLGQRVRSTFKPVHTGSIYGFPSKIIAFLACVFGVTFPITGVIMWVNRLKKKNKKVVRAPNNKAVIIADEDDDEV